jgi:hypothetical protein
MDKGSSWNCQNPSSEIRASELVERVPAGATAVSDSDAPVSNAAAAPKADADVRKDLREGFIGTIPDI